MAADSQRRAPVSTLKVAFLDIVRCFPQVSHVPRIASTRSSVSTVFACAVILTATSLSLTGAPRATAGDSLLSPSLAGRLGLTEAWQRSLAVPAGAQSIIDQRLFVDRVSTVRNVEVVRGSESDEAEESEGDDPTDPSAAEGTNGDAEVLWRSRVDQQDRFGNPIGEDEARRLARNEVRKLKRREIEATVAVRDVPAVLLYTLSNDGTLDCRDAETGRSHWLTRVGDRELGYRGMGLDENYLSVINGANLLVIDATDGSILNQRRTIKAPAQGAVHVGEYVLIPSVSSGIEGHVLTDPRADTFFTKVSGAALQVPTRGPGTNICAWGTANGFVYVMELEGEPSIRFRLRTAGIVDSRIAAEGDRFYFASEAGQVYAVHATYTGDVLWSRPFGEPFYDPPSLHDDTILLRSTYGNLYSLDAENGDENWDQGVPGVNDILAVFDGQIYVRMLTGHLAVLNLETGDRLHSLRELQPANVLINRVSNRLYLLSDTGTVQCLRPESSKLPQFNSSVMEMPEAPDEEESAPEEREPDSSTEPDPFDADDDDPFAPGEDDPFDLGDDEDPFGNDF